MTGHIFTPHITCHRQLLMVENKQKQYSIIKHHCTNPACFVFCFVLNKMWSDLKRKGNILWRICIPVRRYLPSVWIKERENAHLNHKGKFMLNWFTLIASDMQRYGLLADLVLTGSLSVTASNKLLPGLRRVCYTSTQVNWCFERNSVLKQ